MGTKLKLGLIQMDCAFGDKQANLEKAEHAVRDAVLQGAGMICLPECFNIGYSALGIQKNPPSTGINHHMPMDGGCTLFSNSAVY